jgi:HEAT repeat protein
MTLTRALGLILSALLFALAVLALLLTVGRLLREWRERRQARLAEPVREVLFELAAQAEPEQALRRLAGLDARRWAAIEPTVVSLLSKVRGEAQASLVRLLEQRGTKSSALRDVHRRSPVRRATGAEILGSLGSRDALAELVRLLGDRDPDVRAVAARALGRIGDPAAASHLLDSLVGPRTIPPHLVAHAVVKLGAGARPALAVATRHASPLVRATAIEIIGLTGAVAQVRRVAEALWSDSSLEVRIRAARALGRLGMPAGLEPLLAAAAEDQPVVLRAVAARALGELGAAQAAAPRLGVLLADPAYRVAHNAAQALLALGVTGRLILAEAAAGAHGPQAALHAREALALAELERERSERRERRDLPAPPLARAPR